MYLSTYALDICVLTPLKSMTPSNLLNQKIPNIFITLFTLTYLDLQVLTSIKKVHSLKRSHFRFYSEAQIMDTSKKV